MVLQELLDSVGLSKSELAKLLGVSRQTVHRMGDTVSDDVLAVVDRYRNSDKASVTIPSPEIIKEDVPISAKKFKPWTECTEAEIRAIWSRRGRESDYDIAHSMGMRVFEFRRDYIDAPINKMMGG